MSVAVETDELIDDIAVRVDRRRGARPADLIELLGTGSATRPDAIVMSLNVNWWTWNPGYCEGDFATPADRYDCLLAERPGQIGRDAAIGALTEQITAVADSGIPVWVYVMPHSTSSLDRHGDALRRIEQMIADADPHHPNVEWSSKVVTRSSGLDEPESFVDMVHPTAVGAGQIAEILAGWLTGLDGYSRLVDR